MISDLILLEFLFISINKNKLLENEFNEKVISRKDDSFRKNKEHIKENKTLDTFLTFNKSVHEDLNFEDIYIEGKRVEIDFNSENLDYLAFIKEIEGKNEFVVKQLSNSVNESSNKAKIIMELK